MPRRDIHAVLEEWRAASRYLDRVLVLRERVARAHRPASGASLSRLERLERLASLREEQAQERYRAACRRIEDRLPRDEQEASTRTGMGSTGRTKGDDSAAAGSPDGSAGVIGGRHADRQPTSS